MAGKGRVGPNIKHYHIRALYAVGGDGGGGIEASLSAWESAPINYWKKAWADVTRMARKDETNLFHVVECREEGCSKGPIVGVVLERAAELLRPYLCDDDDGVGSERAVGRAGDDGHRG